MKRVCMKTAMLLVAWCCTMGAWAYDFEADGIYYGITSTADKTVVVVVGDAKHSGDVTIPATVAYNGMTYRVTSIGEHAFYDCSNLASIVIPEGVTSIRDYAFYDCSSLTSIVIPKGITFIGKTAFSYCSSLTSIVIPETVTAIESSAFYGCSSLASIVIPARVTSIESSAFAYCSSLTSIVIPEGVTTIGNYTFWGCSSLASITIPENVTTIEWAAFSGCSNLQEIHSQAITPPTCGSDCFLRVNKSTCTLYVPKGSLDAYKAADGWKDFVNIVEEEYTGIEEVGADSAGQAVITACGNGIVVENLPAGTAVTVYTLSGTVVYEGVASGSRTELTLPAGHLYLVKCGPTVTKVAL